MQIVYEQYTKTFSFYTNEIKKTECKRGIHINNFVQRGK